MSEDRPSDLLSPLPRSRPQRRSDKRPARAKVAPENDAPGRVAPEREIPEAKASPSKPVPRGETVSPGGSKRARTGPRRTEAKPSTPPEASRKPTPAAPHRASRKPTPAA